MPYLNHYNFVNEFQGHPVYIQDKITIMKHEIKYYDLYSNIGYILKSVITLIIIEQQEI